MKTKVEIEGYEIEIELDNGVISVKAEKEDEIIEEFTINIEEKESQDDVDSSEVQGFDDFEEEEDDFEGEGAQDDEEIQGSEEIQDEEDMPKGALESFQSFINRRK
jgi:hypothetical protein